jgi:hypothetical protein
MSLSTLIAPVGATTKAAPQASASKAKARTATSTKARNGRN